MTTPRNSGRIRLLLAEIGVTLLVIGLVWFASNVSTSPYAPSLESVLTRFRETFLFEKFGSDLSRTLLRLVAAFVLAGLLGVAIGLLLGLSRIARLMSQPVVTFLRSIPPPAMVPVAFVLLGNGDQMIIAIAVFVCVWPVVLNTQDGVAELDATLMASARAYGIKGTRLLFSIVLPAVLPRIFAGMRISLAFAFIMVIVSEIMSASEGLGYLLTRARSSFNIPDMWAGILMIGLLGYLSNLLLGVAETHLLRWHREWRRSVE